MADKLLSGFRALDLTDEKGGSCAKLLASMGVDVIKVENPGGDPARNIPPFIDGVADPERSLYWLAYNTDKRSITLNLETKKGQDLFKKLAEKTDFIIESFPVGYLDSLGIGYEVLSQINQKVIMCSITPFGQKGPHSHYKGSDLVVAAMGGMLSTIGDPDRAPVKEALDSVYFEAGAAAAVGLAISHYYRQSSGIGQQVDVSMQACVRQRAHISIAAWMLERRLPPARSSGTSNFGRRPTRTFWSCKDGYLVWLVNGGPMGANDNQGVSQWMNEEGIDNPLRDMTNWREFDLSTISRETLDAFQLAIETLFLRHTKKEIDEEALKRRMRVRIVSNVADVLEDPHFKARGFWTNLKHLQSGKTLAYPKYFFQCSETDNFSQRPAPLLGEHNAEIYERDLGLTAAEMGALKRENII